jgi:hypothetical protein
MATADLEATTVETFSDQLRGSVLRPGDEGYGEARTVGLVETLADKHDR